MKYVILFFSLLISFSCANKHHHEKHRFSDVKKWAKAFEDPKRDAWQKPNEIIKAVGVKQDSIVADIGSATGYFPVRLAKVSKNAKVWAIDLEPELVNYLNDRARVENHPNLYSILGTPYDSMIPEKVDFIFMVNTYHHISNRIKYFKNLKLKLKQDGKVVIVDFKKKRLPFGPKVEMKLSHEEITSEMLNAGYKLNKKVDILEYQNILVFE